jgi:hypothetical protein
MSISCSFSQDTLQVDSIHQQPCPNFSTVPGVEGAAAVAGQKGAQFGDVVEEQVWVCTAPWTAGQAWPPFAACCVTV